MIFMPSTTFIIKPLILNSVAFLRSNGSRKKNLSSEELTRIIDSQTKIVRTLLLGHNLTMLLYICSWLIIVTSFSLKRLLPLGKNILIHILKHFHLD